MPYVPADEGDPDRVEIEGDPNFGKKYENPPPHAVLAAAGGYDFCCECLEIERKQVLDEEGNPIADNDDPSETGFRTVCTPPPGTVELMNGFLEMSLATLQPALDFGALFINPDGDFQIPVPPDLAAPIDGMAAKLPDLASPTVALDLGLAPLKVHLPALELELDVPDPPPSVGLGMALSLLELAMIPIDLAVGFFTAPPIPPELAIPAIPLPGLFGGCAGELLASAVNPPLPAEAAPPPGEEGAGEEEG
jgi:hypothetical protein